MSTQYGAALETGPAGRGWRIPRGCAGPRGSGLGGCLCGRISAVRRRAGTGRLPGRDGGRFVSTHLAELRQAADLADDDRRAIGRIPEVLREPAAAAAAWERWEAAHETLTAARREAGLEAEACE